MQGFLYRVTAFWGVAGWVGSDWAGAIGVGSPATFQVRARLCW